MSCDNAGKMKKSIGKMHSVREKLLKFEAEGREFAKFLRSLEQFVGTVKGQNSYWYQNVFLTCSWRFLRSINLVWKNHWDLETCRKSWKRKYSS